MMENGTFGEKNIDGWIKAQGDIERKIMTEENERKIFKIQQKIGVVINKEKS